MNQHGLPPQDIDARVDDLVRSPLGCAFLLSVDYSGVSPAEAVKPSVSLMGLADAVAETTIWSSDYARLIRYLALKSEALKPLARAILEHPGSDWWFAPIDRKAQVWAARAENASAAPTQARFASPSNNRWATWENRPNKGGLYTATLFDGETALFAALDSGVSELSVDFKSPAACWRLIASESARVYEITSPMDAHELCARYPTRGRSCGDYLRLFPVKRIEPNADTDEKSFLTVDWEAAAKDWDGVHLTFGGLLTSDSVRIASSAGWSMLMFWDLEQTLWLRWAFDTVERMPDYRKTDPSVDDIMLGFPMEYELPEDASYERRSDASIQGGRIAEKLDYRRRVAYNPIRRFLHRLAQTWAHGRNASVSRKKRGD